MSLPKRLYKFGSTIYLDIADRFSESLHNRLGWSSIPLSKDYNIRPIWSRWVLKEEAEKAEKWFAREYPKNFYCDTNYNGITECRDWQVRESRAFHEVLLKKFRRDKQYDLEIANLVKEGTIIKTHSKIYYIMLTRK